MTITPNKLPINLDALLRQRTVEGERACSTVSSPY